MKKRFLAILIMIVVLIPELTLATPLGYTPIGKADGYFKKEECNHKWVLESVISEATCAKAGKGVFYCSKCHKTANRKISVTYHIIQEWTVIKEAVGNKKGKRTGICCICGKKITQDYYTGSVLYIGYSDDPERVIWLQTILSGWGYYTGSISGIYDKATANAVKKFQKRFGLKADGICWDETLIYLGMKEAPGTPITDKKLSGYSLKLTMEQVSEIKSEYKVGDIILYRWTLQNPSKKKTAHNLSFYSYRTVEPNKKTDLLIDEPEDLVKKGTLTGNYEYTVTKEDASAGIFTVGYVFRGTINKKTVISNTVAFRNRTVISNATDYEEVNRNSDNMENEK